ncbi:MAG: class I SAM-dependent methyltransferase [Actinobacteria bacterium]|nr:class I SAM-dependent methyltransferase [Actinomycetota bacterium]
MEVLADSIPSDWYATAFDASNAEMAWTDRTVSEVDRALKILKPRGDERILDLACGSGRHALELRRRGFAVVGVDISPELIEIARGEATVEGLDLEFVLADLRELAYEEEFDLVLNLNDGAIGYLESDEENRRAFATIARALRPGGRNLAQLPNVLYAREHLPQRSWIPASSMVELVEHRWNKREKRLEGLMVAVHFGQVLDGLDGIEFSQRLYTLEELREIYSSVGMELDRSHHGSGRPREPTPAQFELFVTAVKS